LCWGLSLNIRRPDARMGDHLVATCLGIVGMIMRVGVDLDVLGRTRGGFVDMHDAHGVIRVRKTWRRDSVVGEREREGRHQDAKHIDRG
jgi:hypothetical protein